MTDGYILDLCDMSAEDTKRLNRLHSQYKVEYINMIDRLSKGKDTVYWWVTHFSCRYYLLSRAYKDICIAILGIEKLKENKKIKIVYCPSNEIALVIKSEVKSRKVCIKVKHKGDKTTFKTQTGNYIQYVSKMITQYKKIRKVIDVNTTQKLKDCDEIVLIDTYIKASDVTDDCYEERYFNNIMDYTDEKVLFMPTLCLNTRASADKLIKKIMRNSKYRHIFKEQFLEISDYFKLFLYPVFCVAFCAQNKLFNGIDVTHIVNKELVRCLISGNSIEGMLKYWAINRMKRKGVRVNRLIGWYEGQPSSNGLFLGYRRAYPNGESIGYQGFAIDKNCISLSPSVIQMRHKAAPHKIAVIAECFKDIPGQFVGNLEVFVAPAFRLWEVNTCEAENINKGKTILVALTYDKTSSSHMLRYIKNIDDFFRDNSIKLLIKNHPCNKNLTLKQYGINGLKCNYEFVDGMFGNVVKCTDLIITTQSTSGYETALYGRPVIFINFPGELNINYMPDEWEGIRYDVVYDTEELKKSIIKFMKCSLERLDFGNEKYFCKASEETVERLFK